MRIVIADKANTSKILPELLVFTTLFNIYLSELRFWHFKELGPKTDDHLWIMVVVNMDPYS